MHRSLPVAQAFESMDFEEVQSLETSIYVSCAVLERNPQTTSFHSSQTVCMTCVTEQLDPEVVAF